MTPQQSDRFELAHQLFHAGDRAAALPIFQDLLPAARASDPDVAVAIDCLIAESLRGTGDFVEAQLYYENALSERNRVSPRRRQASGLFAHYAPRAQIGLIMVLRRQLSSDHQKIRDLIRDARESYQDLGNEDLLAQLALVEGLFERQLYQIGSAQALLEEAHSGIANMAPPYLFLHPDHIEALLTQTCLCRSYDRFRAEHKALQILRRSDSGRWTLAVGASALLELRLRDRLEGLTTPVGSDQGDEITDRELFVILHDSAQLEQDPFLLTECQIQRLARASIAGEWEALVDRLRELADLVPGCPRPLALLRAVEASGLRAICPSRSGGLLPALEEIREQGLAALRGYEDDLGVYEVDEVTLQWWKRWLTEESRRSSDVDFEWSSEEMMRLRAIAWP